MLELEAFMARHQEHITRLEQVGHLTGVRAQRRTC
jgi:hypothetical protein